MFRRASNALRNASADPYYRGITLPVAADLAIPSELGGSSLTRLTSDRVIKPRSRACLRAWRRNRRATLSASIRVARLHERETARFGKADPVFLEWAAQYDEGRLSGRSLSRHTKWLAERSCPIIRLDGDLTVEERIDCCLEAIKLC